MTIPFSRRRFLGGLTALVLLSLAPALGAQAAPIRRPIPSTGERVPAIGMGTWRTFNVGSDLRLLDQRAEVLERFFRAGGTLVDSSSMYGSAEAVMGRLLERLQREGTVFAATKIWTGDGDATREEAAHSRELWGIDRFDLLQVHNLLGVDGHLPTLRAMKAEGRIRYLGVTTSHGRRHDDLERLMTRESLDFVQLTYNVLDRTAEQRLLPLAREKGIAVIANRPFRGGRLFDRFESRPLPEWAGEAGVTNWAEYFLKFIISHPDITCAIPATTQVEHMQENMGALHGRLPDPVLRRRMVEYLG
ncbi:aldo/keto reductase [Marinobacter halodurans]|uniref:Aldo/keto reductase n=1 Tax=Marinobacter halodurans TaxID=2528979 RepID=A0ABY1ZNJ6_9GAMM|nr:aldo/keto reductase [Marinobacter halodurans]TBW57909.1 aldo/keto reductase [Marinobacter halodurans]